MLGDWGLPPLIRADVLFKIVNFADSTIEHIHFAVYNVILSSLLCSKIGFLQSRDI